MTALIDTWSANPKEDDSMTDGHAWIWHEMIRTSAATDLTQAKVLDVGCNQGGFLRLLYDARPFAQGVGVDLARDRVALANEAKGQRPITYIATAHPADAAQDFDLAFSHEVIYLVEDLEAHAASVAAALKPHAIYDAVTCCHADNPLWDRWHPMISSFSNIPVPSHTVADIQSAFRAAGFDVSVSRFLANAYIPTQPASAYFPTELDLLETYTKWKLCFRCQKR
ncbi:MAG: class I SAM-dependent methyltransferase [Pseudomonadota bacterium]